ncbi:hypothetical protein Tco_1437044 [Tanacetum coccineum]
MGLGLPYVPSLTISLPPETEVGGRFLAMTTPSPSPPISLSSPSAGERLARCTAPPAHSPPLPPSSGCLTQIQTLRITSTQALIDAVTAALPPPSLPTLHQLSYIPPVDYKNPPTAMIFPSLSSLPARGCICQRIRDTWVDPVEAVPEIAPRTVGEVNTRVTELAELHERDTQDLYALLEDAQDVWDGGGGGLCYRDGLARSIRLCRRTHQELQTHRDHVSHMDHLRQYQDSSTASCVLSFRNRPGARQMVETLRFIRGFEAEMSDMQAELLALREQRRTAGQSGPEARIPDHQEASGDADNDYRPRHPVLQILWGIIHRSNIDYAERIWEEFVQSIQTFLIDKKNLTTAVRGKKKSTPLLIPSIRFTKLIIYYLKTKHNIHPRTNSPIHYSHDETVIGTLRSVGKDGREIFGMPIPNALLTDVIKRAPYYGEYLEHVAKYQQYLNEERGKAGEEGVTESLKATKVTKPKAAKQTKPSAPKAAKVTKPADDKAPKQTSSQPPKSTLAPTEHSRGGKTMDKSCNQSGDI